MWVEVKNLRNLDKALREAEAAYAKTKPKNTKKISKSELAHIEKRTKKQIIHTICWIIMLILIVSFIGMIIINSFSNANIEAINGLTDTRLILYEEQVYTVKKLGLLFQITDDVTYQNAKASIKMSDELKAHYFINQAYSGPVQEPITVEYKSIQYEITESDSVCYFLTFTTNQGNVERDYRVQAEYYNDELVYINVL